MRLGQAYVLACRGACHCVAGRTSTLVKASDKLPHPAPPGPERQLRCSASRWSCCAFARPDSSGERAHGEESAYGGEDAGGRRPIKAVRSSVLVFIFNSRWRRLRNKSGRFAETGAGTLIMLGRLVSSSNAPEASSVLGSPLCAVYVQNSTLSVPEPLREKVRQTSHQRPIALCPVCLLPRRPTCAAHSTTPL